MGDGPGCLEKGADLLGNEGGSNPPPSAVSQQRTGVHEILELGTPDDVVLIRAVREMADIPPAIWHSGATIPERRNGRRTTDQPMLEARSTARCSTIMQAS